MTNEIFLSYSSKDKDYAERVINYIEDNGYDCFIASRDISGGNHYAKNIVNVISACKLVILIASSNSNESEHVLNEIDICVEKKKKIIPLFIEDFDICDEFRYYLGRSQRVVVHDGDMEEVLPRLLDSVKQEYPKKVSQNQVGEVEEPAENKETNKISKTVFEYDHNRGIMINPEDRMRNISFRQDTLLNLMGGIYESIKDATDEENANAVYYQCGYEGGSNFGARLNSKLSQENLSLEEKLSKWCEFDSTVGWGKFKSNIVVNEDKGTLEGTISINECFMVDKKKNRRICSYIKGYCTGVIGSLLGDIEVELTCQTCPIKNKFKSECVFGIALKMEE
ncbi:MAG: toll/interleukin-1 receptor domain-containing protein [Lachnospiraceae bacterium]|nr:toll/interleukin-1 receptor domain-containing protein [Lachnospiraceae bacterium]